MTQIYKRYWAYPRQAFKYLRQKPLAVFGTHI